jgi:hypothetical protein
LLQVALPVTSEAVITQAVVVDRHSVPREVLGTTRAGDSSRVRQQVSRGSSKLAGDSRQDPGVASNQELGELRDMGR